MSEAHTPSTWKLQFLTDVTTAAGLLEHGKQCKGLAARIGKDACRMRVSLYAQPTSEINAALLDGAKEFAAYESAMADGDDISAMIHYANASRMLTAAITKATKPVSAGG